ncbi:MAG: tRNA (adenosine(37)-N6)-threonylcarbamoyltransferase complex ATPase subunit type 1 TsaE [Hyphomicrobiaceae bacterium]
MTHDAKSTSLHLSDLDESAMQRVAMLFALGIKPGDTLALHGDLGAGKTTFARGLIRALIGDEALEVVSPTFSLVQIYDGSRGRIEHYDLYRLKSADEAEEIGLGDPGSDVVRIIEWPERLGGAAGGDRLDIHFEEVSRGMARTLVIEAFGTLAARLERLVAARGFIANAGWSDACIAYLQGDASTRRYARLRRNDGICAVLMDSPRQPDGPIVRDGKPYSRIAHLAEDVRPFAAVDRALRKAGLSAPDMYAEDLDGGFLLLEDLGDRVFGREADGGPHQKLLWSAALDMLVQFRKSNLPMTMPVSPGDPSAGTHALPELDATILGIEVALLPDWYWREIYGGDIPADVRAEYEALWRPVIGLLLAAPKGWILRDVHSPNLLWLPERDGAARVGVIDFQDAIAGPWAHDVMSLLQDARVDVPTDLEAQLLGRYVAQMSGDPGFDEAQFLATYAAYGALRATRLLGLFVRLLRRDGKPGYLAHLPRNWGYLERNLGHPALQLLAAWYDRHFPPELRKRAILP